MEKLDIYSWVDHGGPLGGLSLRTLLWIAVLRPLGGIIGTNLRMKEQLASMSTGTGFVTIRNFRPIYMNLRWPYATMELLYVLVTHIDPSYKQLTYASGVILIAMFLTINSCYEMHGICCYDHSTSSRVVHIGTEPETKPNSGWCGFWFSL